MFRGSKAREYCNSFANVETPQRCHLSHGNGRIYRAAHHSIVRVALRRDSIIQVKTVVLIAVIALSRKFVILDSDASPAKIAALAGATLALGATYWLLRKRGDRAAETSEHDPSSSE